VNIHIKRVYEPAEQSDGYRVLVDRLWPRGLTKDEASLDEWLRDIAPSSELRHWYAHEPEHWSEFKRRYRHELRRDPAAAALSHLRDEIVTHKTVTLLYGAKDEQHNNAIVLLEYLNGHHH
jgi:uncharacterized protein YeaO (DUF488 family)